MGNWRWLGKFLTFCIYFFKISNQNCTFTVLHLYLLSNNTGHVKIQRQIRAASLQWHDGTKTSIYLLQVTRFLWNFIQKKHLPLFEGRALTITSSWWLNCPITAAPIFARDYTISSIPLSSRVFTDITQVQRNLFQIKEIKREQK